MHRLLPERVLLVGDLDRHVESALGVAVPTASVTSVPNWFDAIAELSAGSYTTVLAAAEPVERRPESAVRTLRQLAGDGRLYLFGHPTLEPLSQKMMDFGCDDYLVTPANPTELQQMFGATPPQRVAEIQTDEKTVIESAPIEAHVETEVAAPIELLGGLPLADVVLEALVLQPQDPAGAALKRLNDLLAPSLSLAYLAPAVHASVPTPDTLTLTHAVRAGNTDVATLQLTTRQVTDETAARHLLAQLAGLFGKIASLSERHNRLQKLAITDDLTGVYNGRYFRHFLSRILEKAQAKQFSVTLLLFDIDNFKSYNDRYGHGVGDEILKQTAQLMRRCCRDHDLVARIGGDEFAVVFWEKDGPRQPKDDHAGVPGRPPQTPLQILERFRRQISNPDFSGLGSSGRGTLTISAGLANFPWNARTAEELIEAADKAVMFGAKKSGKNTVVLVGDEDAGTSNV